MLLRPQVTSSLTIYALDRAGKRECECAEVGPDLVAPIDDASSAADAILAGRAPGLIEQTPGKDSLHNQHSS